ncbi:MULTISPECIES: DUF1659 domain-containing protein [Alicyclobacillus]|uniref:DUF1659 domain-containing protein n=1 Tax=Alicyclobacillus acidoterrestris (strain ATCC 49025 / DSM 3922 / CIP 106132 / NCIMB 13137 / GD3B) TaxID=1356854 RepID=T0BUS4_ALIAG|nr:MULTISPECIES: DUF1659 domain-containing protein [Alicyclobacillus]EPZ44185.1 hypothetical protein N007_11720 [Alicyclobacillus acidoterrestris ATCC 49025]UNO49697.1 DUF1659 domain-containing protein [Alicyclobacillus acidoterrestris]
MAQTTPVSRILQIQTQNGTTASGQPKMRNTNYANVAMNASDDDLLAVGQALAALIGEPLVQIARVDQVVITQDASASTSPTTGA